MLSENLLKGLNAQITAEFSSSYLYLSMASYAESIDFDGIANFFKVQAQEELDHAMKIYNFLVQKGENVEFGDILKPNFEYDGVVSLFKICYDQEQLVTKNFYNLADIAYEDKEYATINMINWFINEQIEEENLFSTLLKRARRSESNPAALYMLNDELATRVYQSIATQE